MKQTILHKSGTRGTADHGWLQSRHTFSFAGYYDPQRMNFGALRVFNDDTVAPGMGFGMHRHADMEILSIPLEGDLQHADSMGNKAVIRKGDVQVMSAGSGIAHSEYNASKTEPVKFLQIWITPREEGVAPRYDQVTLNTGDRRNRLQQILSPNPGAGGVWVHQDAWAWMGMLDAGVSVTQALQKSGNGFYAFVLSGEAIVDGQPLQSRDALGITGTDTIQITAAGATEILLLEIPVQP